MALTDAHCRTAKTSDKPKKMFDSGGLFLYVTPSGAKRWRVDYTVSGKRQTKTIGSYPAMTLVQARETRDSVKDRAVDATASNLTSLPSHSGTKFSDMAKTWFVSKCGNLSPGYKLRIWNRIDEDILPTFGERDIASIEAPELLSAIRKIEERNAIETAKRVLCYVNNIFKFAKIEGKLQGANPASDLVFGLKPNPEPKRRKALKPADLTQFFERIEQQTESVTRLALELVVHTFVRTNEVRLGSWDEIGDDGLWRIPAERMKMSRDHIVPLSRQAQQILRRLKSRTGESKWIMPQPCGTKPQSANAMIHMMYRMGYSGKATVHGFRGLASTALNESTLFRTDVIEMQLAHAEQDDVRAAYNSAEYLAERIPMMQWYSDYLDSKKRRDPGDLSDLLG